MASPEGMNKDDLSQLLSILGSPGLRQLLENDGIKPDAGQWETLSDLLEAAFAKRLAKNGGESEVGRIENRVLCEIVGLGETGLPLLSFLLEKGYTPSKEVQGDASCSCLSPLRTACYMGNTSTAEILLESSGGRLPGDTGHSLMTAALQGNRFDVVRMLVQKREVDLTSLDSQAYLAVACSQRRLAIARYFVRQGIKLVPSLVDRHKQFIGRLLFTFINGLEDDAEAVANHFSTDTSELKLAWNCMGLKHLHRNWFFPNGSAIRQLDLAENKLQTLPDDFFVLLTGVLKLDLSKNDLRTLGEDAIKDCKTLSDLNVSNNQLGSLPAAIFCLANLKVLRASRNFFVRLPESNTWMCKLLKRLDVSRNKLIRLPPYFQELQYLREINVSHNQLEELPADWGSTVLETLKASHNKLKSFPLGESPMWILKELDLSHNELTEIQYSITQASKLCTLNMSHNQITELPNPLWWKCTSLQEFNLSSNLLNSIASPLATAITTKPGNVYVPPRKAFSTSALDNFADVKEIAFPDVFKDCLQRLFLDDNHLLVVPESVANLTALNRLGLSGNSIRNLPNTLGKLTNCWDLQLQGLDLLNIPSHVRPGMPQGSTRRLLAYLRAQLRQATQYNRIKLMVVGLQNRGKTTLLAKLRGDTAVTEGPNVSTVGVKVDEWTLQPPGGAGRLRRGSDRKPSIVLSTWDMAGQTVYYATHQCFLSGNALYLACFNLSLEEEGVENLKPWLLNIQARASESCVVIVGTFKDRLLGGDREQRAEKLLRLALNRYNVKGYPNIVGVCAVSSVTGEGIATLQQQLYDAAMKIEDKDTKEPLVQRLVPKSYVSLQSAVSSEAQRRRDNRQNAILTQSEFMSLVEGIKDNDIHDEEELHLAAKFLHEAGVLLHYDDQLRGLNSLYFVDPSWLIDLLAQVVTVKERHSFVRNGILSRTNVPFLLRGERYPEKYIDQYLQLLERFEIALALDSDHLLIPSMLPEDRVCVPGVLESGRPRKQLTREHSFDEGWEWVESKEEIQRKATLRRDAEEEEKAKEEEEELNSAHLSRISRYYVMAYIPSGFWSRLIVRLVVHLERAGFGRPFCIRSTIPDTNIGGGGDGSLHAAEPPSEDVATSFDGGSEVKAASPRSTTVLWRTGVAIVYGRGQFEVQRLDNNPRLMRKLAEQLDKDMSDLTGISVTVWTKKKGDFSALGYVIDQIDGLIEEWFPGLTEFDVFGSPLIQRLVPYYYSNPGDQSPSRSQLHLFSMQECAAAVLSSESLFCPATNDVIPLTELVPELMLTDLPDSLCLNHKRLEFQPTAENCLGSGGAGQVYRGYYNGNHVAVKCLTMSISDKRSLNMVQLQMMGEEALRVLKELRQEASVLAQLHHPNIIPLLGFSLRPLCIALELAPGGSLSGVLEAELKKMSNNFVSRINGCVLGREMTFRIAYQVIKALAYLHEHSIVYRDLKSDNILVWSLSFEVRVNVKLSDYGISRFSSVTGIKGGEGTPGFLAPEAIKRKDRDSAYDEKVDIFAYGMVLFELFTGTRPYANINSPQEINRVVYRGDRPDLKKHMAFSGLPKLEEVMYKCWRAISSDRPSADDIIQKLNDPSLVCLCHQLPHPEHGTLAKIDCLFARRQLPLSKSVGSFRHTVVGRVRSLTLSTCSNWEYAWVWAHKSKDEEQGVGKVGKLSLLTPEMGAFRISQMNVAKNIVLSAAFVDGCIWLAIEGETAIDVFGWPVTGLPKRFGEIPVGHRILDLVTVMDEKESADAGEPVVQHVIASTVGGSLCVFARKMPYKELRQITIRSPEKITTAWEKKKERTIRENCPGRTIALVSNQTELWGSFNENMVIVDATTLESKKEFPIFDARRSYLTQLVADKRSVYGIDKRAPFVFQWDIATRQLVCILDCSWMSSRIGTNVRTPVYDKIYMDIMKRLSRKAEGLEEMSKRRRRHKTPPLGSLSSSFYSTTEGAFAVRPSSWSLHGSSGLSSAAASGKPTVIQSAMAMPREPQRVTSLLIVKDSLWVARGMGDVLVLKRDVHGTGVCLLVGHLKMVDNPEQYGNASDQKLVLVDGRHVISSQFLELRDSKVRQNSDDLGCSSFNFNVSLDLAPTSTSQQLLAVYSAWGASDFKRIDHFLADT